MMARGLIEELKKAKGSVVNVTSIAGSRVHPFAGAAYATSKAALAALTREMASDFGPLGIRVNAISPGEIDTAILSPGTEKIVETIPLRRLGQPAEVAKLVWVIYLAYSLAKKREKVASFSIGFLPHLCALKDNTPCFDERSAGCIIFFEKLGGHSTEAHIAMRSGPSCS